LALAIVVVSDFEFQYESNSGELSGPQEVAEVLLFSNIHGEER
jgi:hypothetical protein